MAQQHIRIVEATTAADIQHCQEVILELRPHLKGKDIWSLYQVQLTEQFQIRYLMEAERAVAFIGYRIQYILYSGKTLYIDDLCTLPEARGKGYASQLLDEVFAIAKSQGCDMVSLDSGHHRHAAHRLYLNHGFHISSHHFEVSLQK